MFITDITLYKDKYFFICLLLLLTNCATVKPTETHIALSTWIGVGYENVIYQLGHPIEVYIDGVGGRVLVFESVLKQLDKDQIGIYSNQFEDDVYTAVWENNSERHTITYHSKNYDLIYIDRDGYVYSYQSNRNDHISRIEYEKAVIIGSVSIILAYILILAAL